MEEDPSNTDPAAMRKLIDEMVTTICRLSDDVELRAIVGSVFDGMSVEDTYEELKAYNEGKRPIWLFHVNDPN